jgi:hypothetical protein
MGSEKPFWEKPLILIIIIIVRLSNVEWSDRSIRSIEQTFSRSDNYFTDGKKGRQRNKYMFYDYSLVLYNNILRLLKHYLNFTCQTSLVHEL